MKDFKEFYFSLSKAQRQSFAQKAGTTVRYIECHLVYARRVPRPKLMNGLVTASRKKLTLTDVTLFFNKAIPIAEAN